MPVCTSSELSNNLISAIINPEPYRALLLFVRTGTSTFSCPGKAVLFPLKRKCQMLQNQIETMEQDRLTRAVNKWAVEAVFFIGGSWYTNCQDHRSLTDVSSELQLRWLNKYTIKAVIEHRGRVNRWLSGWCLGNYDPMVLGCFTRNSNITDEVISVVESVTRIYLPKIGIAKCGFCGGRFGLSWVDDKWTCDECERRFAARFINKTGFVYIFGSIEQGFYKIGQSQNPPSRLSAYRRLGLPFTVEMIHTVPVDDVLKAEAELHYLFREKATGGEWFKLSGEELEQVVNLMGYVRGQWVTN